MCRMSDPVDESFLDQYLEPATAQPSSLDKPRPVRQGLPSGYRMRHDAHYVDELESRRRPSENNGPALAFPTSIPVTFALRDMSQELEGVASCFKLVALKARPLRERMGLSLALVGVERNMRAFQALRVLLEDPPPEPAPTSFTAVVEHTIATFDDELRLTGLRVSLDAPEAPIRVTADARMLSLAMQACVGTLVSLAEASNSDGVIHIGVRSADGAVSCEMRQDIYRLSADQFSRLADLEWSERPGGIPAGIGLAAAARIAQAHGGGLDARRTEAGGCVLSFTIRA
jgi:signal transduction histidine kinase